MHHYRRQFQYTCLYFIRLLFRRRLRRLVLIFIFLTLLFIIFRRLTYHLPALSSDQLFPRPFHNISQHKARICNSNNFCSYWLPGYWKDDDLKRQKLYHDVVSIEVPIGMTVTLLTNEARKIFQYGFGECVDEGTCRYVSRLNIEVDLRLALEQIHTYIDDRKLEELIYYHKSQFTFIESDVTLISQFTVNRLERFEQALGAWSGPVSAVIYLISPHDIGVLITYFSMDKNAYLYSRVDLTIVKPDYSNGIYLKYPINKLRNIGIEAAPTNYIFVMDADFVPTPQLYEFAVSYVVPQLQTLERPTVFVVPCVALVEDYKGRPPRDISDLRRLYSNGWAYVTDPRAGHGPTGTKLLLSHPLKVSRPYYEVCYESQWEPYYILPKSAPMYDERFRNQGGDKQQHTLALNALKYRFLVLREHFIYHLDHAKLLWPGGGFKHAQLTEKEFTYFEHYIPELEKKFGITVRWPRGCSRALFRDQMRDLVGIGVG